MATWAETRAHLQQTFTIAVEQPEWIGLGWKFKPATPGEDVLQRQRIELVQAIGAPHLLVLSDIIEVNRVPMRTVLEHNMTLAIGGIAISDDVYVLRAVVPLEHLDFPYFDRMLAYIAHEAARLRESTPAIQ
ncbi:MAG: hypothetical protein H6Q90_5547 [Deltaproteobacteria bacterium]|nr:hypothetical protein [Deltaproteobacteria bacterium]